MAAATDAATDDSPTVAAVAVDAAPVAVDDDRLTAGGLVRAARGMANLTQVALAQRCGVPAPVLSAIEHGRRQPTVPTLQRILRGAGLELCTGLGPHRVRSGGAVRRPALGRATTTATARATTPLPQPSDDLERARALRDVIDLAERIEQGKAAERRRAAR